MDQEPQPEGEEQKEENYNMLVFSFSKNCN
jgi:hypothetical protein